jgi:hypothetical protein
MAISDDRLATLRSEATVNDPRLQRLARVDGLTAPPERTMSEMTGGESVYFALIEALNREEIVKLPGTVEFLRLLRENRVSLDRKGRREYLQALVGTAREDPDRVGTTGSLHDAPDKKRWWQFWKKGDDAQ